MARCLFWRGRYAEADQAVSSLALSKANEEVAVRAGVRRGRLSDTMRALMFWSDDWHRNSDWYTWTLTL